MQVAALVLTLVVVLILTLELFSICIVVSTGVAINPHFPAFERNNNQLQNIWKSD